MGLGSKFQLILGNKYNYVIDTGLGSISTAPIKEYIKHDNKPTIVINTHYHWDHIWGNHSFKNCTIISHKLCREMISSNWGEMVQNNQKFMRGDVELCLPTITFDNELYFPEDKIRIMYTPGHTRDSISVLDEADKVLHAGDNIGDSLEQIVPSLEVEANEYMNTLLTYRELDFETCLSGHNIILDKGIIENIIDELNS